MNELTGARLTVPEAAFVVGLPATAINREIDARIIPTRGAERTLRAADLFYLAAIKHVRDQVRPSLRKSLRLAIHKADAAGEPEAKHHYFVFDLTELRKDVLKGFEELERTTGEHVEARPEVLGGEPVLKGTRIAVRHVADLVGRGATARELQEDYDLSAEQVEAALAYCRIHPKRGRPPARRSRRTHVPPAR